MTSSFSASRVSSLENESPPSATFGNLTTRVMTASECSTIIPQTDCWPVARFWWFIPDSVSLLYGLRQHTVIRLRRQQVEKCSTKHQHHKNCWHDHFTIGYVQDPGLGKNSMNDIRSYPLFPNHAKWSVLSYQVDEEWSEHAAELTDDTVRTA